MAAADSPPSDSACPVCSKPIRSGSVVLFEHGELFHVHCRSRQLQLRALEQVDRAEAARERAARRLEDAHRVRAERRIQRHGLPKRPRGAGVCPLCRGPAIVTDWRPGADWIAVENCPCGDFFAGARLVRGAPAQFEHCRTPGPYPSHLGVSRHRPRGVAHDDPQHGGWPSGHPDRAAGSADVGCPNVPDSRRAPNRSARLTRF